MRCGISSYICYKDRPVGASQDAQTRRPPTSGGNLIYHTLVTCPRHYPLSLALLCLRPFLFSFRHGSLHPHHSSRTWLRWDKASTETKKRGREKRMSLIIVRIQYKGIGGAMVRFEGHPLPNGCPLQAPIPDRRIKCRGVQDDSSSFLT